MKTTKPLSRKSLKRSQPKRDWSAAREKVEREGECRLRLGHRSYTCEGKLEAGHILGREHDRPRDGSSVWSVWPVRIVPLCRRHHQQYDAHEIDLLPVLLVQEQVQAVIDAGSLELARKRTAPSAYR